MPGRLALAGSPDMLPRLFEAAPSSDLPKLPNYNICPTDTVHGVVFEDGVRKLTAMRWGFLPPWYKTPNEKPLLINARSETIAQTPSFREACRERRCLVPVSGYFEWTEAAEGRRLPWYVHAANGAPLAFAGIWQDWTAPDGSGESLRSCAIVTTLPTVPYRRSIIGWR